MSSVVSLRGGAKSLPGVGHLFVDVDLDVLAGQSVGLVGKSGSGKSTLLAAIGLLDQLDAGALHLNGSSVNSLTTTERDKFRARHIGMVFQRFALIAHLSVLENVMAPLRHLGGHDRAQMRSRALDALDAVGMAGHAKKSPLRLSGGEQQRVGIARATVKLPKLLIADEPTGSLDATTGEEVMDVLLESVKKHSTALLVVTHELDLAERLDAVYEFRESRLFRLDSHAHRGRHAHGAP